MSSVSSQDQTFLRRAFRLAMNGRGQVEPNPMVGCVLVRDGQIIGEGFHTHFGGPHAEPSALADCAARGNSPAGATAYVTLEPCCHTNKKTPPCAPRVIQAGISRVVIGCLDPNPQVNGNGVAMLRAAGIHVDGPVLEGEAKQLIAPFLAKVNHGRPYVTLKWAQTADGKIAGPGGKRMQISSEASSRLVHQLRARSDAIVIGARTMQADDPTLTARGVEASRPLLRAVLASDWVEVGGNLLRTAKDSPVLLYVPDTAATFPEGGTKLRDLGVETVHVPASPNGQVAIDSVLQNLSQRGAAHVMVEPGARLAAGFIQSNLVDRLWIFRSPKRVDDDNAPAAASVPEHLIKTGELPVGDDVLTEYLNPKSDAFFAAVPSADFVLATPSPALTPSPSGRGLG